MCWHILDSFRASENGLIVLVAAERGRRSTGGFTDTTTHLDTLRYAMTEVHVSGLVVGGAGFIVHVHGEQPLLVIVVLLRIVVGADATLCARGACVRPYGHKRAMGPCWDPERAEPGCTLQSAPRRQSVGQQVKLTDRCWPVQASVRGQLKA